ncbi:MAG: hydrogenase formation protein HypD [Desulfomonilia bacterium]
MKYIDEYRDGTIATRLKDAIQVRAHQIGRPVALMEVCGSHTYAIGHYGIRNLLPESIRLISGPGCPVCVTSGRDVDTAMSLAQKKNVIFTTFGDMLRVPGSGGNSLQKIRAQGADVRVVASTIEAIEVAEQNPAKEVIFMGIGFETTSPTVASMVKTCLKKNIRNLSIFSVHKIIPPAIKVLLDDPELVIDGFICPGHVSTIIGFEGYTEIPKRGRAAVITGFEPVDILEGIYMILGQIAQINFAIENQYSRAVKPEGNTKAKEMLKEVFMSVPAEWRGLGVIDGSGLVFKDVFASFNALARFDVPIMESSDIMGCMCGSILRGIATPHECPLFRHACNPQNPIGPCMVSREGTCSTYYKCH